MLKKLSAEGRHESGLDKITQGKVWAFIATMSPIHKDRYGLGVAIANEPGYYPIPLTWANSDSWDSMSDHATELNRDMGLTAINEARIICSTMGGKAVSA